ncbi:ribosome silencing factor [bacterium]|nr:MAG: ribosome silencing factor [bacterium]
MNRKKKRALKSADVAHTIGDIIVEFKGEDVRLLDLRGLTDIADWFVIASAQSRRHLRMLGEDLVEQIKRENIGPFNIEGLNSESWVIIDLFDIVVHLFIPERREYFGLEDYWADAPVEIIGNHP